MKKIVLFILIVAISVSSVLLAVAEDAETGPVILVEGAAVDFPDAGPFLDENGRTQIPVGALAEALGLETEWNPGKKTATVKQGETVIRIAEGEKEISIDGTVQEMDTSALLRDDRMYIPLRYVAEALGFGVSWDQTTGAVDLTSDGGGNNHSGDVMADSRSFDFALLDAMPKDKNYMVSPFSLKMALAMAANGAQGETLEEILEAMGVKSMEEYNNDVLRFMKYCAETEAVELSVANSIWFNEDHGLDPGLGFSQSFETIIKDNYGGSAERINNANGAKAVNDWVAEKTKGTIKNILNDKQVEENLAFLVNTIYFKGDWDREFNAVNTADGVFTDRNGDKKTVSFMQQTVNHRYYEDDVFAMLEKPYKGGELAMYIVLPKDGATLDGESCRKALTNLESKRINLKVPKFKTETTHQNLIEILRNMGIKTIFDENRADLGNMFNLTPSENIYITDALQKTFIEVGEKGTEASAATAIMAGATSAQLEEPVDFICNRPFVYFIMHTETGEILFMGEYAYGETD